jgi:hypothetical protein
MLVNPGNPRWKQGLDRIPPGDDKNAGRRRRHPADRIIRIAEKRLSQNG